MVNVMRKFCRLFKYMIVLLLLSSLHAVSIDIDFGFIALK